MHFVQLKWFTFTNVSHCHVMLFIDCDYVHVSTPHGLRGPRCLTSGLIVLHIRLYTVVVLR